MGNIHVDLVDKKNRRETFGSKAGFVLSCISSATGVKSI